MALNCDFCVFFHYPQKNLAPKKNFRKNLLHWPNYTQATSLIQRKDSSEGTPLINLLTCCTSARCSPAFDCLYSKNNNFIIPNRRRFAENRKNQFPARKTSFSQSKKLVSAKQKKSPICKIKLPQKFSATRYCMLNLYRLRLRNGHIICTSWRS